MKYSNPLWLFAVLTCWISSGLFAADIANSVQHVDSNLTHFGVPVERLPPETEFMRAQQPSTALLTPVTAEEAKPGYGRIGGETQIQSATFGTHVQGGHSGGWFNLDQVGHGLFIEVIANSSASTGLSIVAAWYAFEAGAQAWVLGVGRVVQEGNRHKAYLDTNIYQGNDFPPFYSPGLSQEIPWGEMTIEFNGCDRATLTWNSFRPGFGSGTLDLQRLTSIVQTNCNPMLGGDSGGGTSDDHGNTWALGTSLGNNPNGSANGQLEQGGDVDVFVFSISSSQDVAFFSDGSTDTIATLYRISNGTEQQLAFNDDGGVGRNFRIETQLSSGQYSLHVEGFGGNLTGPYLLNYQSLPVSSGTSRVVHFDNRLLMPINLLLNGVPFGSVPAASAAQDTLLLQPGDVFSFEVIQDYGDTMIGVYDPVDNGSGQINLIANTVIGNQWFFIPYITNNSAQNPLLAVNWELASQNLCNCTIPAFTPNVRAGYFYLWSNSNVVLFFDQYGGSGWRWDNFAGFVDPDTGYILFTY